MNNMEIPRAAPLLLLLLGLASPASALSASSPLVRARVAAATAPAVHASPLLRRLHPPVASAATLQQPDAAASTAAVAPEDEWIARVDLAAFGKECRELGSRLEKGQGEADVKHLKRMILWSNLCGAVGVATMWMKPNFISVMGLSLWTMSRWTMIAHHTCHGGYNKQDDGTGRFTSLGFALGSVQRRAMDWLDWMLPEAWNVEHNNLHHFRTGEPGDPDLVERNLVTMRDFPLPAKLKYVAVAAVAAMWKWFYYAPNTYKQLRMHEMRRNGEEIPSSVDKHDPFTIGKFLPGMASEAPALGYNFVDYMRKVAGPFMLIRFLLLPVTPKSPSFFMRQVITSVNFRTANGIRKDGTARPVHGITADANDFMHGWLNYQIEHHLWPQLSMLSYQKAAPQLRAICEKHGVPYVQHSVFRRLKKTADVMVGAASMRQFAPEWEAEEDKFEWKA
ncbi:hypothetical protein EMIHUDRAFT_454147 [Emiliania huxleyi CCMP1516]|uniref:Fatty acid desaturase domain-containing protein n=2 Tax=Emiliania huxleyi TaxID=2903 RepID=A0A0D3KY31_EMIH1|nr:hypothetical protein EMIHUDRAFT_454147 [Emiliania huxleyi CCMP1516]EOD40666.1 hypothetical protein EMIHUDRAFT_454147 [Emiliania huxleyi CCMP1516]|eukprot:XP_005793095.1 hypothetical protein EMIHUDRAFT_454147 [Emiliania huxleyi CCMP1516]